MSVVENESANVPGVPGFVERRRPGRIENVNPALIPLLRGEATPVEDAPAFPAMAESHDADCLGHDDLACAKGLMLASLLGICAWAVVIAGAVELVR